MEVDKIRGQKLPYSAFYLVADLGFLLYPVAHRLYLLFLLGDFMFSVLDLFNILLLDPTNKILIGSPSFFYSRVSRKRDNSSNHFSDFEKKSVESLISSMASERDPLKIKDLNSKLNFLLGSKAEELVFQPNDDTSGYPVASLVFHEDRPNISFSVKKTGIVDIAVRLGLAPPDVREFFSCKSTRISTHVFRSFSFVKNGEIHIEDLPACVSPDTYKSLVSSFSDISNIPYSKTDEGYITLVLPLKGLPVVDTSGSTDISGTYFCNTSWNLLKAKAAKKVCSSLYKELFGSKKKSDISDPVFPSHVSSWLAEQGITESGFSPPTIQGESTSSYRTKELTVSFKGYSSLPSLKDVRDRVSSGKTLTGASALMNEFLVSLEKDMESISVRDREDFILSKEDYYQASVRNISQQVAQMKYKVMVTGNWFSEIPSSGTSFSSVFDDKNVVSTVTLSETDVKV